MVNGPFLRTKPTRNRRAGVWAQGHELGEEGAKNKCKTGEIWLVLSEVHSDSEEPLFTTPNTAVFVLITKAFQLNLHSTGDQERTDVTKREGGSAGKAHLTIHFFTCLNYWTGASPATVCRVF